MSFSLSKFYVVIYGQNKEKIEEVALELSSYNVRKMILEDSTDDCMIVEDILKLYYTGSSYLIINADIVKRINIKHTDEIGSIINKASKYLRDPNDPYIIMFNRFLDCGIQSHYLGEIVDSVSIFRSFYPGGSNALFLSENAVKYIKNNDLDTIYNEPIKSKIFSLVRDGIFDAFSFNPNLYVYRLECSSETNETQAQKCSVLKSYDGDSISDTLTKFFSDRIIGFWIFLVFFICVVLIILLKIFQIGL